MEKSLPEEKDMKKLRAYGIDPHALKNLVRITFRPGEVILRQGEEMDSFYVVAGGRAKVCQSASNGESLILCYYISSGVIGDAELMEDQPVASTTLVALTDFVCLGIPYAGNMTYLRGNLAFMSAICRELSKKLLRASDNLVTNVMCPAKERLTAYIRENSYNSIFAGNLSDAACSLGISYRHLLRLLNELCEDGILKRRKNGFCISR